MLNDFSFEVSAEHLAQIRAAFPLAIAGVIVWSLWLYRVILSAKARPIVNDFRTTTSVVVPSYHEDPDILMECVANWRSQNPDEIIIVLDVEDAEAYHRISALADPIIRPVLFKHAGKRSALGVGIRMSRGELLVLTDSDTQWTPGLLDAVQQPFLDPEVGAVSTQQNVFDRQSSVWRRIADWMVNLRYYNYVPAMGRAGAVPCVSGRTGAYRRSVVMPVLDNLENEFFLGRRCVAGDDGRLTWLVLASGYKTVHQSSAKALSMFPSSFKAFVKQRVRWSRNSYRCYLTAAYKGWLWKVPLVTKVTVLQILLTPVTMGITLGYLVLSRLEANWTSVALAAAWLMIGRGIRGFSHLRRHPRDLLLLPLMTLTVIFVALPIKLYAFLSMNKQGWLTRTADTIGGEGQTGRPAPVRTGRPRPVPTPDTVGAPVAPPAAAPAPATAPTPALVAHAAAPTRVDLSRPMAPAASGGTHGQPGEWWAGRLDDRLGDTVVRRPRTVNDTAVRPRAAGNPPPVRTAGPARHTPPPPQHPHPHPHPHPAIGGRPAGSRDFGAVPPQPSVAPPAPTRAPARAVPPQPRTGSRAKGSQPTGYRVDLSGRVAKR